MNLRHTNWVTHTLMIIDCIHWFSLVSWTFNECFRKWIRDFNIYSNFRQCDWIMKGAPPVGLWFFKNSPNQDVTNFRDTLRPVEYDYVKNWVLPLLGARNLRLKIDEFRCTKFRYIMIIIWPQRHPVANLWFAKYVFFFNYLDYQLFEKRGFNHGGKYNRLVIRHIIVWPYNVHG